MKKPLGPEWKRFATDPPSTACTLIFPIKVTDGVREWSATTSTITEQGEDPLWWRFDDADSPATGVP